MGRLQNARRTCFSCGKPGQWRNECPLLAVAGVQQEGKKLSDNYYDLYDVEPVSGNSEFSEFFDNPIDSCIFTTPAKGDFSELECGKESVRGRLKSHFSAWEEIGSPWFRNPRSPGDTIANSSPSPSPFSLSAGNYSPRPVFLLAREVQEA